MSIDVTTSRRRPKLFLNDGRRMVCPRCREAHDILRFVPLLQVEEYTHETVPIYKCPQCRWVFAPDPRIQE